MRFVRRISRLFMLPLLKNGVFFFAMYALGILCAYLTLPDNKGQDVYDNLWLELFLDVYFACAVLTVIPAKVRRWVSLALYVVLYGVALTDVFCFWKFGSVISPSMLMLVGETDSREAGEFLSTYLSLDVLSSPVAWIMLLFILHSLVDLRKPLCRLLKVDYAKLQARFHFGFLRFFHRYMLYPECGMLVLALLAWSVVTSWGNKRGMARLMTADTIGSIEHILTEPDHGEFYLPIYRLVFSVYSNHLASQQVDKCVAASKRVVVDSCSFRSPTIVLIIGESYSKAHCQLYGYPQKDTPRQRRLERGGWLTKFNDVVSCWNLTSFVFKNVLSMHVVGEKGEWCDYPLFPELFRKAGYQVTFLTNQFLLAAGQAVYDFSGGFFLNDPVLSKAQFDLRNTSLHRFDEGLLSDYDNFLNEGKINLKGNNLIIFHLIGQHVSYNTRYPKDRAKWHADDYKELRPDIAGDHYRRRMIAAYDNACLYNDSIVTQIVKRFEDKDAIVVYMPDHGEEIFEPGRDIICRNHSAAVDWPLAHYEFEVPFWIWCSRKYAHREPEVFKAIKDAKNRRFMTDALPHMMVWLAGISSKDYNDKYNLLSPNYDESRPRVLKNSVDYDKLRDAARQDEKAQGKK
ncbi:MAG: phosphoethanolamine transferase [Prevotella sp.]|nr:phosphoethanolamine transferase [Prevotella sp.]